MTFAWPHLLWLLLAPAALFVWEMRHRRRIAGSATHPKILRADAGPHAITMTSGAATAVSSNSRVRPWLALGLAFAIVALARPQWGRIDEPVFDQSREILLAVDLSRSMLAPDVRPSRLERAKLLIQSLLEKLQGERVGLIVFSGTAFLQSPLSSDYEILREFLPALGPDFLPEGGTNYRALIDTAIEAFGAGTAADRFLIVLSDGEATDDDWRSRVDDLKKKGVRVIGLGVGTAAGAMIPDGSGGLVKDERGAVVLSKLESGTLQELATATNGAYRDASTWIDLAALIKETVDAGRKGQFVEKNTIRRVERFQWPLALALWCLLVSFYYEFPVRPRVRDIVLRTGRNDGAGAREKAPTAAALLVLALLLPAGIFLAPPARAAATAAPSPGVADGANLGRIIRRLAGQDTISVQDYAEVARETLLWGRRIKEGGQRVPRGPVKDALQAVDELMQRDSRKDEWTKLRSDLEALLDDEDKKPPEQKQQQQQQKQQDQNQQNRKNQQNSSSQQQQSGGKQQQQSPQSQDQQNGRPKDQNQPQNQNEKADAQKKPGESAFGDMKEKSPPPPPPQTGGTQQVGGAREKKEQTGEPRDPALALPLQKLDQLKNQDSPAQLFQLMESDKKTPNKTKKDW